MIYYAQSLHFIEVSIRSAKRSFDLIKVMSMVNQDSMWHERLTYTPKIQPKVIKTANDALISDLPTHTLKWIKSRRHKFSGQKVVLNQQMERQLREIFNGIDINRSGVINLYELKDAVAYVQRKMREKGRRVS